MMPVFRLCACLLPIIGNYLKHSLHIFLKLFKARWASRPSSLHRGWNGSFWFQLMEITYVIVALRFRDTADLLISAFH